MNYSAESAPQQVTMPGTPPRAYDGGTWTATPSGNTIIVNINSVAISGSGVYGHTACYRATATPTDGSAGIQSIGGNMTVQSGYVWPSQSLTLINAVAGKTYNITVALNDDVNTG